MDFDEFINKALTVPFLEKGRSFEGWDCYGLIYMAYKEIYGINLPEYLDYNSTNEYEQLKNLINASKPLWEEVNRPQSGDVAVFNLSGSPCHVALIVDKYTALHCESKIGTFIESLKAPMWKKRLDGIYRHNTFIEQCINESNVVSLSSGSCGLT